MSTAKGCTKLGATKLMIPWMEVNRRINYVTNSGIATDYGLDDRMIRVRILAGSGNFSLRHSVKTGSAAHSASYPMGTEGSFPAGKAIRA